jgi:putative flippase GtrA
MIKRELLLFLVIGSLTVLIDFLAYRGLVWGESMGINTAKATGFLIGTVFAYFANRIWTFGKAEHAAGSAWRFIVLYAVTLGSNVLLNAAVLMLLGKSEWVIQLAFFMATGVSAVLNFIGMKWFVFTRKPVMDVL